VVALRKPVANSLENKINEEELAVKNEAFMKRHVMPVLNVHDRGTLKCNCVVMQFLERAHKTFPFSAESDSDH
jgi:hypothetical protein